MFRKRLPKFISNSYFLLTIGFACWMLFFDSEDLVAQYQLTKKVKKLNEEKAYYIEIVKKEREELMSNQELLEKFAREKYFMKKPTEDVYVIVDE